MNRRRGARRFRKSFGFLRDAATFPSLLPQTASIIPAPTIARRSILGEYTGTKSNGRKCLVRRSSKWWGKPGGLSASEILGPFYSLLILLRRQGERSYGFISYVSSMHHQWHTSGYCMGLCVVLLYLTTTMASEDKSSSRPSRPSRFEFLLHNLISSCPHGK